VTKLSLDQLVELMDACHIRVTEKELDDVVSAVFGPSAKNDLTPEMLLKIFDALLF